MGKRISPAEIGRSGLRWSSGYVYDEFLPALYGLKALKVYREMSDNDPIIFSFLHAIKQIIREARWDVKAGDPEDAECKADADFLRDCMGDMSHSWIDFITEILSMFVFGWSYFEQVFKIRDDGKVGWKKIAIRAQESLEKWDFDDNGGIKGMWQRPAPDYKAFYLPMNKCLLFRTELSKDNPEGRSLLRGSYRPWYFKKNIQEIEGIGIERDIAGMPVMTSPEGFNIHSEDDATQTALTWAKKIVQNVRNDEQSGIFLPFGWKFELLSSPGQKQFDTTAIINRYNKEMAVTALAQFIMLGMERTGSFALAKEQTEMFYMSLNGWGNSIASIINRYGVKKLMLLNGVKNRPLPSVVHTTIGRPSLKDISTYIASLVNVDALEVDNDLRTYLKNYAKLTEFSEVRK